ncbi:MAG: branched-chain amino acid ABC transporter permease [Clostridia bacterium]|nr:branched-chain amino acid ABC transporter permease [Clostridia bacterium]
MKKQYTFVNGLKDGIPIALGYLSVSFSFGLLAVNMGIPAFFAVLISMTNLTSAGQFAGVGLIAAGASIIEMIFTQIIINIRYSLMSISISQKIDKSVTLLHKLVLSFFITDEIFAVASSKDGEINKNYMYGLGILPFCGWSLGTLLGAVSGGLLPVTLRVAMGVALYAMFIAVVVPVAKKSKSVAIVVLISITLSCIFKFISIFKNISNGFVIIFCAIIASSIGAWLFPVKEDENGNS